MVLAVPVTATLPAAARQLEVDPQGYEANQSGQWFEARIRRSLEARGFVVTSHAEWRRMGAPAGEFVLTNAPYTTLYGTPGRTEFLLMSHKLGLEVRIEAKFKSAAGSFDEKLPYVYLTAVEAAHERSVFVVIDGPGWRPGSVEWLKRAAAERRYGLPANKEVRVFSLAEFTEWAVALPSVR
ncbi:MAG TPA: PD-(D/E)XK nuclease superfamily protein [Magnetospirillum sp.]|nr:PD-(D/E)XK nuclease superfamily protein [Magnetospirillum sp.]